MIIAPTFSAFTVDLLQGAFFNMCGVRILKTQRKTILYSILAITLIFKNTTTVMLIICVISSVKVKT